MLILCVTRLFFLISCDYGGDWIIIFIYLVSEGKHGETTAKISCNLIFECLTFLFSSINGHSIQSKFPRKLCNSIINIDITNISVTIFANITTYILSKLKGSDAYEKCNLQVTFEKIDYEYF